MAELSRINQSQNFKKIEQSRFYSTPNDVFLGDSINTISEIICAIEDVEKYEKKAKRDYAEYSNFDINEFINQLEIEELIESILDGE
jgi:hypothetical protein